MRLSSSSFLLNNGEYFKANEPGISWGGQGEVLQRIVIGFSPGLFPALANVTTPHQNPVDMAQKLTPLLAAQLQAQIIFAPMPIQDAIDLGRFLVHAAIMYTRFTPGANIVDG
jgi:hypothetical protein